MKAKMQSDGTTDRGTVLDTVHEEMLDSYEV